MAESHSKMPHFEIKRGDDFDLDFVITDTSNADALITKAKLDDAYLQENPNPVEISTLTELYTEQTRQSIVGWGIAASIRWCGRLIHDLTVTMTDAENGKFKLSAPNSVTSEWVPRECQCDIEFTVDNKKSSSMTFLVNITKDETM